MWFWSRAFGPGPSKPGGTVNVSFKEFAQGAPIEVHLDSPTGPLLATQVAPTSTMTTSISSVASLRAAALISLVTCGITCTVFPR